jgi:uncharacterized membrane-anchored protein
MVIHQDSRTAYEGDQPMDLTARSGRILLAISVLLPVLVLGFMAFQKARIHAQGVEVRFPVVGYDPRDILAGHYLTYTVDYGTGAVCAENNVPARYGASPGDPVCLCLTDVTAIPPSSYEYTCEEKPGSDCVAVLKGRCERGQFTAGLERYYINEQKAEELDRIVRRGTSRIVVKIDKNGNALVHSVETP